LADIYDSDKFKGKVEVVYEYDHGDSWEHQIVFLGRADPALRKAMMIPDDIETVCLGGEVCIFCLLS
jgi:phosphoenolpyruvate carboxylase